jgi:hypothetical protein
MLQYYVPSKHIALKGMQDLLKKEKELHKEIRKDYKKISEKITLDLNQIQKLRTKK